MIYYLISFLGCFIGYFIAKYTKEELKSGAIYFNILEIIILGLLSYLFIYFNFNIYFFIIGILLGVFFKFEYFYFGLGLFSNIINLNFIFLASSLVFIYGLPYGSMLFFKKNKRYFIYSLVFFLPLINYFFKYNLLSFASGGLISILIIKIYRNLFFK